MVPRKNLKDLDNWQGQNFAKPCQRPLEGKAAERVWNNVQRTRLSRRSMIWFGFSLIHFSPLPSVSSTGKWLGTKFQAFLSSANWFRTEFWVCLSSAEWLGTKFLAFSVPRNRRNSNGMNENFHHFCIPQNIFLGKWQHRFQYLFKFCYFLACGSKATYAVSFTLDPTRLVTFWIGVWRCLLK